MPRHHGRLNRQIQVARSTSTRAEKTIPNSRSLESQTDHQRHYLLAGQTPQHHQPWIGSWPWPTWLSRRSGLSQSIGASPPAQPQYPACGCQDLGGCSLCLGPHWSLEQIADNVAVSHESVFLHGYANKADGGDLHKKLSIQKPGRKLHLCGGDRQGQIPNRRPISERPCHIQGRKQVGHREDNTILARHTNEPS